MKTIINMVAICTENENNVLNSITNFNDVEQQTKLFENSTKLWAIEMDNAKTARRWIYDLCRLLRHDIANGKNCVSIPNEIADLMNVANTKFDRSNTDFGTDKQHDDGVLTICIRGITYLVLRTYPKPEKPETANETKTETTGETSSNDETANVSYRCKNTAENRKILTNNSILYTDNGNELSFDCDKTLLKKMKIRTIK